jgi:hypothetical protein
VFSEEFEWTPKTHVRKEDGFTLVMGQTGLEGYSPRRSIYGEPDHLKKYFSIIKIAVFYNMIV